MILEQHYLSCLAQASYLIGDESTGRALVVDPRRDVEVYLEQAAERGLTIEGVLLTHVHADFLAGHLELAARTGATIYLGAAASAEFDFTPLEDGQELSLGQVRVRALATPGHTPESVCYLVFDDVADAQQPHAVLTGDTLFLGDVGRPDLLAASGHTREGLAGMLYDSLRTKLLPLPDETVVYPGHGAGSACGKSLSSDTFGSLGEQRRSNYALQEQTREQFIAAVTDGLQPPPAYFPMTSGLNRSQHAVLEEVERQALRPLDLAAFLAARAAGAQVLDVRTAEAFAAEHLAGSLNVGLDGNFASWAGQTLELERDVLLVAPDRTEALAAVRRLGRIGVDRVAGYLEGGPGAWSGGDAELARTERLDVAEAKPLVAVGDARPRVLDVRQPGEVATARIAGSVAIPLGQLRARMDEVPRDAELLVHCKAGYRSMIAASLLEQAGIPSRDLRGGFDAWQEQGAPVEQGQSCGA